MLNCLCSWCILLIYVHFVVLYLAYIFQFKNRHIRRNFDFKPRDLREKIRLRKLHQGSFIWYERKVFRKLTFLTPDTNTRVYVSGGKKYHLFWNFAYVLNEWSLIVILCNTIQFNQSDRNFFLTFLCSDWFVFIAQLT